MTLALVGSALALAAWLCVLVAPHQPHRVRERLEAAPDGSDDDLGTVTAIIPARDEAELIGRTIAA
ncbi:MAG TPA: glycosyl transferase family 2, partial [Gammaproteobacteria bacterium]|nr:glycosyl transferase family 2 [Gammaproteobacteria bacterium]